MKIISRQEAKNQNLKTYYTGKPCKHGHVSYRRTDCGVCITCAKKAKRIRNDKRVVKIGTTSREQARENGDAHYFTGKKCKHGHLSKRHTSTGICMECSRLQSSINRKVRSDYITEYRERYKTRCSERGRSDTNYKLLLKMREIVRRVVRLSKSDKDGSTLDILGYTPKQFKEHLESLFTDGMGWHNHGEWHIDHIYPVSKCIDEGVTDPKVINALENLQPLWAKDNLSKSNNV